MGNVLFIGATHGDECIGIEALRALESAYDPQAYGYNWIVGNPNALKQGVRFTDTDLNRSAPGDPASASYEERRAAEIVGQSKDLDAIIDIHGTVAESGIVAIIPKPSTANLALARSLPIARNVIWYSQKSAIRGPLSQHVLCPALEIECGPKDSPVIRQQLTKLLGEILLNRRNGQGNRHSGQTFYEVYEPLPGPWRDDVKDFQAVTLKGETFYPFLASQYEGKTCYKMRRVQPENAAIVTS